MGFLTALAFLTRVPVRVRAGGDLARAAPWFPVVGALVGAGAGLVGALAARWLGVLTGVLVLLTVDAVLTGLLHLDGLADTADGLGVAGRERRLAVMKDSATGVFGVVAVVLALALTGSLLVGLASGLRAWGFIAVCAAGWAVSRCALVVLAAALPYAREEGTGRSFVAGLGTGQAFGAVLTTALVCAAAVVALTLTSPAGPAWTDPTGWWAGTGHADRAYAVQAVVAVLGGAVLAAAAAWGVAAWARRSLGGVTGDVLGAAAQMTLITFLLGVSLVSALAWTVR